MWHGIWFDHKEEQNNVICSNMHTARDQHTKWIKPEREGHVPYDIIYMWNLNNDANEFIKQKLTQRLR